MFGFGAAIFLAGLIPEGETNYSAGAVPVGDPTPWDKIRNFLNNLFGGDGSDDCE